MGWVAARLRAGPIPTLRSLWHRPSLRRTEGGRRERCERIHAQETRLAAGGGESRRNYALPAPSEAPPRAPCARTSPATRTAPPRTATLTTPEPLFPHPPSEVWRARGPGRSIVAVGAGRALRSFRSLRCLRTTQRGGATPKMVAVGRSGPCPQLIRYRPARFKMRMRGLSRASGASQASAARNARNPRASVSSVLEAQETRLASPTGSQGHSPVRPSSAAGAPAPPAQAPGTSHRTPRAQAFRVSEGHKKRVSPHPPSQAPRSHPPRTTRQRFGEPQLSKLKSESSDMRGGFGSLASARQPYAGRRLRRREACALWALARSAKRPAGVSKYKGCARPARRTPIFARCQRRSR